MFAGIAIGPGGIEHFDFVPSRGRFDDLTLFDCATASPARLVLEMGRRMLRLVPTAQVLVIGNPVLTIKAAVLANWATQAGGCPAVIGDQDVFPLGYVIPASVFHGGLERFLLLLSTFSASADAELLQRVTGQTVARAKTSVPPVAVSARLSSNGTLAADPFAPALAVQAVNAVRLMDRRADWRDLPLASYHPYHAGDVLFFSIAGRSCHTPLYQEQVVCRTYADIWRAGGSRLGLLVDEAPPLPRDDSVQEGAFYLACLDRLGPQVTSNRFIVYARYCRYYNLSPFHLIDHARFSLGDSIERTEDLFFSSDVPMRRCEAPAKPLKVLFNPNGGWPLKGYRPPEVARIVLLLAACGAEVTVLEELDPSLRPVVESCGGRFASAPDMARLTPLIQSHHVLVGSDSLPHHYAACVLGHPTIGLFGNTSPWNSCGPNLPHYRFLTGDLPCAPCGTPKICRLTDRQHCQNLPSPERLVAAVLDFAEEIYGA